MPVVLLVTDDAPVWAVGRCRVDMMAGRLLGIFVVGSVLAYSYLVYRVAGSRFMSSCASVASDVWTARSPVS